MGEHVANDLHGAGQNRGTGPTLADIRAGESARIQGIDGDDASKRRLMALGIVAGKEISLETKAPLGDPRIYTILGYRLTIRNEDAKKIRIARNSA